MVYAMMPVGLPPADHVPVCRRRLGARGPRHNGQWHRSGNPPRSQGTRPCRPARGRWQGDQCLNITLSNRVRPEPCRRARALSGGQHRHDDGPADRAKGERRRRERGHQQAREARHEHE